MADDSTKEPHGGTEEQGDDGAASDEGAAAEQEFFAGPEGGEDEVDPELVKLPRRKRKRRHPVISLVVIGLSVYLMYFLRQDIGFFLEPSEPAVLGDSVAALQRGELRHNSHVKLEGTPDRKNALIIESRAGGYDSFFRLMGTGNRLFVQKHREGRATDDDIGTVHAGQLVRFDSLPYAESLRDYLAKRMTMAHDLSFAEVKAALARGGARVELRDVKGERLTLTPDSTIWVNVAFPDEWVVQFSKHAFASPEQARQELARRLEGLAIPAALEDEASRIFWRFVVLAEPDQFAQLRARFKVELQDGRPRFGLVRRQVSYSARFNQLKAQGETLEIDAADPTFPSRYVKRPAAGAAAPDGGAAAGEVTLAAVKDDRPRIPAGSILYISTSSPFAVPDDAMVLLMNRAPGDNWYYLLLYLVLAAFVGLNLVTLVLRLRGGRGDESG